MTDGQWATVWELFSKARELSAEQHLALLNDASLDPDIRNEVISLLEVSVCCSVSQPLSTRAVTGPEFSAGYEFGRYVIVGSIGLGGFGRIYAARDKELKRIVALKVLTGPLLNRTESLLEEARAASALNHPNIVTVYETISADDHLAIAMEFVDGKSLRQVLQESAGALPPETLFRYGRQMAQALAAAHEAGILHRDIKPENILVRKDGYIKLVDFGLATYLTTTQSATPLSGTLRYMSPEQLRGEPASAASDVFSLGLVLYEMAAGVHAFRGETPLEVAGAIAAEQPDSLSRTGSGAPPKLDRLILAMLSQNPTLRPASSEVTQALEQIASTGGRRFGRPAAIAFAGLILLAVAVALTWAYGTRRPPTVTVRLDTKPLTGEAGQESKPALSQDGASVVYSWRELPSDQPVTFVRDIGSDHRTVLPISSPYQWLPDGRRIAFLRHVAGVDVLCTILRDGTGENEILRATEINDFEWSPDGKQVIYSAKRTTNGNLAIFLFEPSTGKTRQITFPPNTARGDEFFNVSPDGRQLAFRRTLNYGDSDLFITSLAETGSARQITFDSYAGTTLTWIGDGSAIIASTSRGSNHSLWLLPLTSPQTPTRLTELGMEAFDVRSARGRNRLTWVNRLEDANIWRVPVSGGKPVRVVSSIMRDVDVASSRLGLLAYRSDRTGFSEIWLSTKDGESQKMVTDQKSFTGAPQWSPDGRRIAFGSRRGRSAQDIFVMDCDPATMKCGPPTALTNHSATDVLPNWSTDGRSIYFASQRSGDWQVWRTGAEGESEATQMTTHGGYFATESTDGNWLYYSRIDSPEAMGVWRKRLSGKGTLPFRADDPGEMVLPLQYLATATWILSGREIYYCTPGAGFFRPEEKEPVALWVYDLETRRTRLIHRLEDVPLARGLALSADKQFLYFVKLDRSESNVMIADYSLTP